jgi:predicted transcriptional regulator of viral defense system
MIHHTQRTLKKLSGKEQELYFSLVEQNVSILSLTDIRDLLGVSHVYARKLAERLCKKNAFQRIKAGLYVRIPEQILLNKGGFSADPIMVASKVATPYFLSYYTACSLHGVSQRVWNEVYITTTGTSQSFHYGGQTFRLISVLPERFFGIEERSYRHESVIVADIERTMLDLFARPAFGGGWHDVITCLVDVEHINYPKLLDYLDRLNMKILVHRLGYVVDRLHHRLHVPDEFLRALQQRVSGNIYYFERKQKGSFNKRWQLIVTPDLEEMLEDA